MSATESVVVSREATRMHCAGTRACIAFVWLETRVRGGETIRELYCPVCQSRGREAA